MLISYLLHSIPTIALAAPPISLPSLSLINNATTPLVPSSPPSSNGLPPSPYYYIDPFNPVTVKFYSYGLLLPPSDVTVVLNTALRDVYAQLQPLHLIRDRVLYYTSEEVYLMVDQTGRMTWEDLENAVWGLLHFVDTFESMEFEFEIGKGGNERAFGMGVVGESDGRGERAGSLVGGRAKMSQI